MALVLGVDGGNSKAIALVAQADGTIVGAARRLGSADIYARGPDAAIDTVAAAVAEALAAAGARHSDVGAATFSMAGADWPEDMDLLRTTLARRGVATRPEVVNDAIGALFGAVPAGPAVVVSVGTGAATGARGPDGRTWHSSFWQAPQAAAELAQRAVRAVADADLGIAPQTKLSTTLTAATGDAAGAEALLHRFTRRDGVPTGTVGAVVRALLETANAGDAVAVEIVRRHGAGLGVMAAAAARRVGVQADGYALSFCGGMARHGAPMLLDAAVAAIRQAGQAPRIVAPRWEPAIGAVVIGLMAGSERIADDVAGQLDATAPGPELYDVGIEASSS